MSQPALTVIKVGGSLFDLPDLGARLRALVARLDSPRVILFPGGGGTADVVRTLDRVHKLGEEAAHWLALRALTVNASFLHALLPEVPVGAWPNLGDRAILDPWAFAQADEASLGRLPHTWEVSSDSLAARAAHLLDARELLLLKSVAFEEGASWEEAARLGIVDRCFPSAVAQAPRLHVRLWNFRAFL
jgi:aspartokinase-like uncharacterized kinase